MNRTVHTNGSSGYRADRAVSGLVLPFGPETSGSKEDSVSKEDLRVEGRAPPEGLNGYNGYTMRGGWERIPASDFMGQDSKFSREEGNVRRQNLLLFEVTFDILLVICGETEARPQATGQGLGYREFIRGD